MDTAATPDAIMSDPDAMQIDPPPSETGAAAAGPSSATVERPIDASGNSTSTATPSAAHVAATAPQALPLQAQQPEAAPLEPISAMEVDSPQPQAVAPTCDPPLTLANATSAEFPESIDPSTLPEVAPIASQPKPLFPGNAGDAAGTSPVPPPPPPPTGDSTAIAQPTLQPEQVDSTLTDSVEAATAPAPAPEAAPSSAPAPAPTQPPTREVIVLDDDDDDDDVEPQAAPSGDAQTTQAPAPVKYVVDLCGDDDSDHDQAPAQAQSLAQRLSQAQQQQLQQQIHQQQLQKQVYAGAYDNNDDMDEDEDEEEEEESDDEEGEYMKPARGSPAYCINEVLANPSDVPVGEYSFGGLAAQLPGIPGLEVDGFGIVPLPIVDPEHATRLANCGRMAPFGKGFDTVTDPTVRRTWEFDRSQFKLTNPAWGLGLAQLTEQIATRLGCPNMPLELHPYKLLLYTEGCHFVKHRDTEKEQRMFATLVVQLPSVHQGGQLVVYHPDGTEFVHDFGGADRTAQYAPHFAVHYADCEHELKPVMAGYRLALVYSICWPEGHRQVDLQQGYEVQCKLSKQLARIAHSGKKFHYYLDHQYTLASIGRLGLKALKGKDRLRVSILEAASNSLPDGLKFSFFMASGQRTVSSCDYEVYDEDDYGFETWYDATGRVMPTPQRVLDLGVLINPDKMSKSEIQDGHEIDRKEEYTGNEGTTTEVVYEKYVLLAIPGPWAVSNFIGLKDTFKQFVEPSATTPAAFNSILATLPNSQDLAVDLFSILVSRGFTESVPAFFATVRNAFTAPMMQVYLRAMESSSLWSAIQPSFLAQLSKCTKWYPYCLELLLSAIASTRVAEPTWLELLNGITSFPIPSFDIVFIGPKLLRMLNMPVVWQAVFPRVVDAFTQASGVFAVGMQLVLDLIQHGAAEIDWRAQLAATLSKPVSAFDLDKLLLSATLFTKLVKSTAVWPVVFPHIQAAIADEGIPFMLGLRFVLDGINQDAGQCLEVLDDVAAKQISLADLQLGFTSADSPLRRALLVPHVWYIIEPAVTGAFVEVQSGFEPGLVFVQHVMHCSEVGEPGWAPLLAALSLKVIAPDELNRMLTTPNSPLVTATQDQRIWQAIAPTVMAAFPSLPNAFEAGLDFVLQLARNPNGRSLHACPMILSAIASSSLSPNLVSRLAPKLVVAMQVNTIDLWAPITDTVLRALQSDGGSFNVGFSLICKAKDDGVPVHKWSVLISSTFSRIPIPSRESLCNWPTQSTLWRILSMAGNTDAFQAVVAAYVAANQPAHLAVAVKEILLILPTIPNPTVVAALLQSRLVWVHNKVRELASRPPSWAIPNARYGADARLDEFLRANAEIVRISGSFTSITQARAFAGKHWNVHPKVSRGVPSGTGRNAFVEFRKDRSVLDLERRQAAELRDEMAKIAAAMQRIVPVQPMGGAGQQVFMQMPSGV